MNVSAVSAPGRPAWLFLILALIALAPGDSFAAGFTLKPVSIPRDAATAESRIHPVNLVDDRRKELVVATPEAFRIYALGNGEYTLRQTVPIPVPSRGLTSKIYYGFARLAKGDRYSILLLLPDGVFYYPSAEEGGGIRPEPQILVKRPLIQGQMGGRPVQYYDFALDLDADGLDDLLLPEENGFSILRQVRPREFSPVTLPRNPYKKEQNFSLQRDVPGDPVRAVTYSGFVRHRGGVSDLLVLDANSDGLQDLVYTQFGPGPNSTEVERYDVFLQRRGVTFGTAPSQSLLLPYDPRADITLRDFNRDGRLDAVSVRSNIDIARPLTVTRLFLADKRTEQFFSKDSYRFVTKDPIGLISIGDYNSDGNPDFATTYFSYQFTSADDIVDLVLASKVRFKLQFFLGRGAEGYSHQPSAEKELVLNMKAESFQGAPPFLMAEDMNGDKAADLLVRTHEDRLAVYPSDGPLRFPDSPAETISISPDSSLDLEDVNGDGLMDLIVSSAAKGTVSIYLSTVR